MHMYEQLKSDQSVTQLNSIITCATMYFKGRVTLFFAIITI